MAGHGGDRRFDGGGGHMMRGESRVLRREEERGEGNRMEKGRK